MSVTTMNSVTSDYFKETFIDTKSFSSYKKWHHSATKFQCDLCSYLCENLQSLTRHKKRIHSGNLLENDRFMCDICGKSFVHKSSFYNHKKWKHAYSKFQCDSCPSFFERKSSLVRHVKNKHFIISPTKKSIKCSLCSNSFFSKLEVIEHYTKDHGISISTETVEFTDEDNFYVWKCRIEKDEGCEYIRKHCKYVSKVDGTTRITFFCHRDGIFKSNSKSKRRMKLLGSNKINGHCPAKITCSVLPSGKITAVFCKTHVGHRPEIGRMRLSLSDKKLIANKIISNIPFDEILNEVRLSVDTSELDRIHLLTRKDLLNIKATVLKCKTGVIHCQNEINNMKVTTTII